MPKEKKIKFTNGSILEYRDGQWYRNGKWVFDNRYKFYDPKKRAWFSLANNGSIKPLTPYIDKITKQGIDMELNKGRGDWIFPASGPIITLRTKGQMNLADIPTNLLDTIAINTGRSKTDIKTNLGLVGTESTFGGYSKALGNPVSTYDSHDLVNNHAYFGNPYTDYSKAIYRKVSKEINQGKDSDRAWMDAENDAEYAYKHNNIKTRTKKYHDNVIADAFARYADNPKGYNPGKGSVYPKVVTRTGNEVWSDPQIVKWWNTEGKKYYNKGLNE